MCTYYPTYFQDIELEWTIAQCSYVNTYSGRKRMWCSWIDGKTLRKIVSFPHGWIRDQNLPMPISLYSWLCLTNCEVECHIHKTKVEQNEIHSLLSDIHLPLALKVPAALKCPRTVSALPINIFSSCVNTAHSLSLRFCIPTTPR